MLHRLACIIALPSDGLLLLATLDMEPRFAKALAALPALLPCMGNCKGAMLLLLLSPRVPTKPILLSLAATGSSTEVTWKLLSSDGSTFSMLLH